MHPFSRREFIHRSAILSAAAASAAGLGAGSARAAEEAAATKKGSAGDRLRVAVVGVRSRGMSHVSGYLGKNNCEIVAVCDCDEGVIGSAMKTVEKGQKAAPTFVKDIRKLLEDKSIDVVSIATPNHWHALAAVWAMRAGKDVYVEKPASHNVHEGRLMADAARKYNRICQVGTQSRSNPGMRQAIEAIHSGRIGKVSLAYGTCYKRRDSIGDVGRTKGEQAPPKTMDYDLWTGPARLIPPKRNGKFGPVHYDWHWIWEYGNGDYGNQGVHEADKARWGLQVGLPAAVYSLGGRFTYEDDGETPNTQLCVYEYPEAQLIFEVRGRPTKPHMGSMVGNIWVGDKGYVVCPNYSTGILYTPDGKEVEKFTGGGDQHHFDNFVKAVRSRKASDLNCDIEEGHRSAALCHLANISYRLGAEGPLTGASSVVSGNKAAGEALGRMLEHLKENGVDVAKESGRVGPRLTLDPKAEKFTGGEQAAAANGMLFREYRKGFEITEAV